MKISRVYALAAALLAVAVAPAFAQRGGRGFGGGFGGGAFMLTMPEVQKELKLEQAQVDLIQQVVSEGREKMRAIFQSGQGGDQSANRQKFAELQAQQEKQIGEILEPAQVKRYKQLQLQQAGTRGLVRPEVAQQLKLTPSQTQSIQAATRAEQESVRATFQSLRDGGGDRAAIGEKMRQIRTETDQKILAVLTDAQKKQYEELKGAPFTFPQPRFGPGGPGGRRPNN